MKRVFVRGVSLNKKKPPQEEKRRWECSQMLAWFAMGIVAAILIYAMVMIAIMQHGEALIALIGFGTTLGIFAYKHYTRRAAQKDNLEQRRMYGSEVFNDARVEEAE